METLKTKIQADFILAMKSKDEKKKITLSSLKAKITELEKSKANVIITDNDIIKVITSAIKQRKQSVEEFKKGNRTDLVENEQFEIQVLESYLPKQLTESEIVDIVTNYINSFEPGLNKQRVLGQTIGMFNKEYAGRVDNALLKQIIERQLK